MRSGKWTGPIQIKTLIRSFASVQSRPGITMCSIYYFDIKWDVGYLQHLEICLDADPNLLGIAFSIVCLQVEG
ncbi:hypothetical protein SAMN02745220_02623 [Desulfopila aestuarii DSM 18488]|uniref:Uncharacterized protein n=1 Tax=Desulfopila aestuarii DSM 18488 TaxID=1121416 RepID=A0A1M7Y8W6_9BACT|nr:hypothetical protein SAMN02745220_02623 [Desulfopila aestuarii DSM 18488]